MKHPKIALDSSMYVNDKKQGEWSQHLRLFVPRVFIFDMSNETCSKSVKATINAVFTSIPYRCYRMFLLWL